MLRKLSMTAPMDNLRDEVRQFLIQKGLRLNTNLGQHFLADQDILDQILDAAQLEEDDHVVEIGPGIGVLTRELLHDVGHVTAIEIDPRMIPILKTFVGKEHRAKLDVIEGNALSVPLPTNPYKIVANIPYHITSPLLRHAFLESAVHPTTLTLLIQREVAEKICDVKHAGVLTIVVALFGEPSIITRVPPGAFLPPPAVDSAVLHIRTHAQPLAELKIIERVMKLVKIGFGQKRKMLRNTLGNLPEGMALLEKAGIDPTRRPENLSIDEWLTLAKLTSS